MVSRFLCTTALEETWRDKEPVLFLGEWCRRYSRKDCWSQLDADVLPYHWDDRAKLQADYLYLQELHGRLLQALTVQLNEMHQVDHSLRYWRILIGPWLGYFVQMLFDRWTSIQQAIQGYELNGTIVLYGRDKALVPNDMSDFARLFAGDEWNHHIYAAILQHFTNVPCSRQAQRVDTGTIGVESSAKWKSRIRKALVIGYSWAARALNRDRDAFLLGTYLPLRDELRMYRRLGQMPQLRRAAAAIRVEIEDSRRQWIAGGESLTSFEACARALIPRQMPATYLEGYRRLREQTANLPWPRRPRFIWTSNSHGSDDVFKAWAAEKVERGTPLVIGQHGGHYGVGRWSFTEDHDIAISDAYLSWGWSEARHPNVKPVGQLKARLPLGVQHARQARALLVTCSFPRFSYWMYSAIVARQWLDYFNDQAAFVARLPRLIQDGLTVRLYPQDFGWDQAARWGERFPDLHLDRGQSAIDSLLRQSRLYISTYNATTYLESFTMNIPTVIYWNPQHWELRDSARPYFEDLQRVGIFHETPEAAADHVAKVWDDVNGWWSSPPLLEALERFKQRYCRLPVDRLGAIETALRDVMPAARKTTAR